MDARCSKTDAGRAEIRARALPLSRTARNLLVIIDGSRTANQWVGLVQGADPGDLITLLDHGLIAPMQAAGNAGAASAPMMAAAAPREPASAAVLAALDALAQPELYTLLTAQAKERFGLIKGYRLVLEVEKCADLDELRALARRFVAQLQDEHGEAGVRALAQAAGLR
jgi:hypothetical protein